jgi:hypothetical protein
VFPNQTEINLLNYCRATKRIQPSAGDIHTIGQLQSLHFIDGVDALQDSLDVIISELYGQFLLDLSKIQNIPLIAGNGVAPLIAQRIRTFIQCDGEQSSRWSGKKIRNIRQRLSWEFRETSDVALGRAIYDGGNPPRLLLLPSSCAMRIDIAKSPGVNRKRFADSLLG